MSDQQFSDNSYPPIGENLTYQRGDGATIQMRITPPIKLSSYTPFSATKSQISDEKAAETPEIQQETAQIAQNSTAESVNLENVSCKTPNQDGKRLKTTASITLPKGVPITINPRARINTDFGKKPAAKPGQLAQYVNEEVMDHPAVGGKVTIFVLFYGNFFELHKKCLTSILATVPSKRVDLRVGSNAVGDDTLAMINAYVSQGFITKHYRNTENRYKYPVMREMFWDETCPIETKWVLWFDDDSICDVEPNWLNILATHITQHHKDRDAHMIGANYVWTTNDRQRAIMASRPWYRNRLWRDVKGQPSPNGNKIIFVAGGFWAITNEALRAADIPDLGTGLTHNGGDWQIGEQLYQAGYGLKQFNGQKQFVRTSSVPRRGETKPTIDKVSTPLLTSTQAVQQKPPAQPPTQPPRKQSPRLRIIEL